MVESRHGEPLRGMELVKRDRNAEGRFGLMFKRPPAFEPPDQLLAELAATMSEPPTSAGDLDNPGVPSGFTFFGQFVDHDLTRDTTPLTDQRADPDAIRNFRSPAFDLDCLYGRGPVDSPELYDPADAARLLLSGVDDASRPVDLPRKADGTANIGDPRNEENLIVCQLQIAFVKFHNALVDHLTSQGGTPGSVFEDARRLARWYYQWVVIHDFLPRIVGQEVIDDILAVESGRKPRIKLQHYKPKNPNRPMMPLEFSAAAYRFGHSMIRPGYRINSRVGAAFFGDQPSDRNLNGFRPIPATLAVDWRNFFETRSAPGPPPNLSRRIDARLAAPLFHLPQTVVPPPDTRVSLAERNLIRGKRVGLASGQAVAAEMGVAPIANRDLGLPADPGWQDQAPLWFYILKEAELQHNGQRLGSVGGRIIAELFIGVLDRDKASYLNADAAFRPQRPIAQVDGQCTMGDLLQFAGAI